MRISIDHRSGIPIYIQIMDQIRVAIASGSLKPGDQLPTVRQMATDLRVNWNTIAHAYRMLDEAGLISTQQGRGTFIWDKQEAEVDSMLRQRALQAITRQYLAEVQKLGCTPQEVEAAVNHFQQEKDS